MKQEEIGKFIASCRKEQCLTQVQFGEKLGVTNKAVSKWETGKCLPDAALFNDICLLLNITLNELFAGEKIVPENIGKKAEENLLSISMEYQKRDYHTILNSCYKLGIKGGRLLEITKMVSLSVLAVGILFTVDLGVNYGNALLTEYHDGIVLTGILSRIIYGDRGWSLHAFFQSFNNMLIVTAILIIENIVLWCISISKSK